MTMNDTREQILNRLRNTRQTGHKPITGHTPKTNPSREALIHQFRAMMQAVHTEVRLVDKHDWLISLYGLLADYQVESLLIGPHAWPGSAIIQQPPSKTELLTYESPADHWKQKLFHEVDAAVTSASGAIAETGSVALWPSAAEPRLMSLVPPVHIVLLKAEQIVGTFSELIEKQNWATNLPSNALLISGPSKSADIEQVLAYGVHGPKSLVVMILS
jgi:L-lactate dehydrogenase complex protein LldG